jgi:hypothetical protein
MFVSRTTRQNKTLVAIAAVDKTAVIDFQPDAGMAKRGTARNIGCAVAGDATGLNAGGFRGFGHNTPLSNRGCSAQSAVVITGS